MKYIDAKLYKVFFNYTIFIVYIHIQMYYDFYGGKVINLILNYILSNWRHAHEPLSHIHYTGELRNDCSILIFMTYGYNLA